MGEGRAAYFVGKAQHAENLPAQYHPLQAHLADVAAVFLCLLRTPQIAQRLRTAAGRELNDTLLERLGVLAALHDVGKYTPCFQKKIQRLSGTPCGHVEVLAAIAEDQRFFDIFPELITWDPGGEVSNLLRASWSHHGSPVRLDDSAKARAFKPQWRKEGEEDPFAGLEALRGQLVAWFPLAFSDDPTLLPESPVFSHLFAGLVMLADWLGSDTSFFPFCGQSGRPGPEADPMDYAREAAERALEAVGLSSVPVGGAPLPSFEEQFPFSPNAVQAAMDALPLPEDPTQGSLTILEAETGSGKTEAAERHYQRLRHAGLVDGLYLACPLRIAATSLHERLVKDFARAAEANGAAQPMVALAVPGYLRFDDADGKRLPGFEVLWPDSDDPALKRRGWACEHPKRFLCAPVAVGTIDQALLAGLRSPHAQMRAAALSRSLLVVDEVHASDVYMTEVTLNLMDLFRRIGGHVLLMSATLGGATRKRYLDVWREGLTARPTPPPLANCLETPYPSLTPSWGEPLYPEVSPASKCVRPRLHGLAEDAEAVADLAIRLAEQGGCVLVLRNKVTSARETFRALEARLGPESPLLFRARGVATPHTSRYSRADRKLLDEEVTARFGKRRNEELETVRPPCILVATQTLEISLDVDFDVLVTDLCPMDVLLQRIGRLQRHANARPAAHAEPVCHVLVPAVAREELAASRTARSALNASENGAYANLASLAATWEVLEEREREGGLLTIPADNRALVERTTHPDALKELARRLGPAWEEQAGTLFGKKSAVRKAARRSIVFWQDPYGPESSGRIDEEFVSTRLGLKSISHAPRDAQDQMVMGPFGEAVDSLTIPHWDLGEVQFSPEAQAVNVAAAVGGMTFTFAGIRFVYDRLGLRKEDEA